MKTLVLCPHCNLTLPDGAECTEEKKVNCTLYNSQKAREKKTGVIIPPDMGKETKAFYDNAVSNATSDQEKKADKGLPNPVLLERGCAKALQVVQATLDYGNLKYVADSWKEVKNGMARYDAAARRHRIKRDIGEGFDRESKLHHLGHEIINNLFLLEMLIEETPDIDWNGYNRNPPQDHKEK